MKLRKLMETDANVDMITTGIIAAMMFAIAIPLILGTISSVNIKTTQDTLLLNVYGLQSGGTGGTQDNVNSSWAAYNATKPVQNSTNSLLTQIGSFFSIGPIYLIVVVAVGIISALLILRSVTGRKE